MNRFLEMIQKGEDLIARTNELLDNEIDLATSGSVDIATYLTDLKAIHAESLEFTNPDVAESLEQYREGMENDEYMDYLTQYLTIRGRIMGELRDRVYDRTAKVDMAFNAKTAEYMNLNREISSLKADIEAINKDIEQLDKSIAILTNANQTDAVTALETAKNNMLARIREKEARIEEIKREQEVLLHGGVVQHHEAEHEEEHEAEHEAEHENEHQDDEEVERAPLPEEDDDDDEEEVEEEEEQQHGPGFVPVFPELGDGDGEEPQDEEEEDAELAPLPVEDDDDAADSDDEAEDEEEEEEEDDQELAPVPEDDEEIEVIHHTDAKPTLLRRIGNVVYAVITFLGSLAAITVTVDHFENHHDMDPALEQESQLGDEDDLEDNPAPDDQEDEQDQDNDQDDDLTQTPDDQTPDDQTPSQDDEDKEDDKDDDKEDDKEDDKDPGTDKDEEQDQEDELGALPAELAPGEYIYDRETGVEVTSTGDAYVHTGDITLDDGERDLTSTDHGTVIVGAEDMQTDQKLPELTGEELTYDEVTEDMSAQEISDLDAALAEWAAQFDQGLTLKP